MINESFGVWAGEVLNGSEVNRPPNGDPESDPLLASAVSGSEVFGARLSSQMSSAPSSRPSARSLSSGEETSTNDGAERM